MSSISLSNLAYIDRDTLASSFTTSSSSSSSSSDGQQQQQQQPRRALPASTAIIDVRDSDHIGGHIRGSTWVPSSDLDFKLPELLRTLQNKDTVVFHCALSQQRGPSAALRYLREKERLQGGSGGGGGGGVVSSEGEVKEEGGGVQKEESGEKEEKNMGEKKQQQQKVYVLRGGFTEWQEKYGEDDELTEGYRKDIWEFGG